MWDRVEPDEATDRPALYDGRVLVVVVPSARDWERIMREGWYRIPLAHAPGRLAAEYLAFYHTKGGGALRWTISHYAPARDYRLARRRDLLPEEPDHPRADDLYYRIALGPLERLPHPVPSDRLRRVTFIATTLGRLLAAREINDLWEREAARDRLWRALRAREIPAERDYLVDAAGGRHVADVAVRCVRGGVSISCEVGDRERVVREGECDWERPHQGGWLRLQFGIDEIGAALEACVARVLDAIDACGGANGPGIDTD